MLEQYDAIVIGAGVSGLYALHHLRNDMNLSVRVYDGADDVGGTWWYNRYPGARVDGPGSPFYCYTFSDELMTEWDWAETQPSQAEVLSYVAHVADRFNLRRDIQFNTWVTHASYDETSQHWIVETDVGTQASARFLVCAVGALSKAHKPDIPGFDDFSGDVYHTGAWPHEPVSFAGKRVGVIGTGSSGVQSIPQLAREAEHLTVFQRTPQYSVPARNRPLTPAEAKYARENWDSIRQVMQVNNGGFPFMFDTHSAFKDTPEERQATLEKLWQQGTLNFFFANYSDVLMSKEVNGWVAEFLRDKIREIVDDPETAEKLMPDFFVGTKRPILDDGYFDTFNRDNVTLVDLRDDPIKQFTRSGVRTTYGDHPLDALVLATGFDAISGAMLNLNPTGRQGVSLKNKWHSGFDNYLGIMIAGFPNLFMIHGPGTPGVLYNMPLGAEREAQWIGNCIQHLQKEGLGAVEPTPDAEETWDHEVAGLADRTLYPLTDSWYTGANIPGKPRKFCVHLGGPLYFERISEVAANGYEGFAFEKKHGNPTTTALG
ncbi:MAG: NAD(P)/FAD-dependent oxidoreductase [Pseudomonadales bacterium]